jgi:hypothetical protein
MRTPTVLFTCLLFTFLATSSETASATTLTTIDYPGSFDSLAYGISGNDIVGECATPNGEHGFWYNGSSYTALDFPGYWILTYARGISGNRIVGTYWDRYSPNDKNGIYGFVYDGVSYKTLDPFGSRSTQACGISGSNIVGHYVAGGVTYGYLYDGVSYSTLSFPESTETRASGVDGNNIVGYYRDASLGYYHGFLYDGSSYTTLDVPGALWTTPFGISGNCVVGAYADHSDSVIHGFLYDGSSFTTLDIPGMPETYLTGISGNNVVGGYYDGSRYYGFLATVPEPSSRALAAFGVVGLFIGLDAARRRKKGPP